MSFSVHVDTSRQWGGGPNQVMHTVLGLRARGERAVLVAQPDSELLRRLSEGLDLVPLASRGEIDLNAAWRLSRVMRQLKPDVIHAQDPNAIAMAATALSIAAPQPKPVFIASHRHEWRALHSSYSRWVHGQVDLFLATGAGLRDRLIAERIPAERTMVVHEGVDTERIARMPPAHVHAEFFLPMGAPIVANVAALTPSKGHHHLIEAAALVVREVPDVRFVIIGGGELRHALEEQIRHKHLERHIFLAGFRPDALELMKGADVCAVSSIHEGMCTALVEAMAAAKPSVATAVGGIPEVVTDGVTGFLVPARDHHAMADRLVRLLKDEALRRKMGEAAMSDARGRFSVDRMVEATMAAYQSSINVNRS